VAISIALKADFDFFMILSRILYVLARDSVPEALINSSIFRGLPAEYRAASTRAVASFSSSTLTNYLISIILSTLRNLFFIFDHLVQSYFIMVILISSSICSISIFSSLAKNKIAKKHRIESIVSKSEIMF